METQNAENFKCPDCDKNFTEEDLMNVCGEPFNGAVVVCEECKKEWSVDIKLMVRKV